MSEARRYEARYSQPRVAVGAHVDCVTLRQLPALASQAFPEEVITALENLHAAIPSLHSFYAPNTHPLPLPALHKGMFLIGHSPQAVCTPNTHRLPRVGAQARSFGLRAE